MKKQHYSNHRRLVYPYHVVTSFAIFALLAGSIRYLIVSSHDNVYSASLIVLIAFILVSLFFHMRLFALRAQDRAIRAEEHLRYFMLTGRRMDHRVTTSQVIALRFASDEEFPSLADRAAEERLAPDAIKKQIRNWRPDWLRV